MRTIEYKGLLYLDTSSIRTELKLPFLSRVKLLFSTTLIVNHTHYHTHLIKGRIVTETNLEAVTYWEVLKNKFSK